MIKKICHLSDIHIRKAITRHEEYDLVFKKLYKSLKEKQPDRIVIVGDLVNDYNKIEGEQLIIVADFLNSLAAIAPVVLTRGNHDLLIHSSNRVDSIEAVVRAINNPKVVFYNETEFYEDDNVVWSVWKHGEKKNNPWDKKDYERLKDKTYIDLYHDPINGSTSVDGFQFKSKTYRSITDFKGDLSFFGDIHKLQYLNNENTKAYSSSLIAQNFGEGDNQFHGYLLWDIENKIADEIEIKNEYTYKNVVLNRFHNFDDLDFEIDNPSKYMRVRFIWKTLPAQKNIDNERKVVKYVTDKYNPILIKHVAQFVEDESIVIEEKSDIINISKREVIHNIIQNHLEKIGESKDVIEDVLNLDVEIENRLVKDDLNNIQWSIVRFTGKNFRSYKTISLDWQGKDGIYQISGKNTAGKSSIIQLITYTLYGKTLETDYKKKFIDAAYVNNKLNVDHCEGEIVLECSGEFYGIKRRTNLKKNKDNEITSVKTTVSYYKFQTINDDFNDENLVDKLNEEDRVKTQRRIDEIIGTFDNFIRIVLTTSDTLNSILSGGEAAFIDSLLNDSGLNIFDLRLKAHKKYLEEIINVGRVNCDVNKELLEIDRETNEIIQLSNSIVDHNQKIIEINERIDKGEKYKEDTLKQLHNLELPKDIASENDCKNQILQFEKAIVLYEDEMKLLISKIAPLKAEYDENKLNELFEAKEKHRDDQYLLKTKINSIKTDISNEETKLYRFSNEIENLKKDGARLKQEYAQLEHSKTCPTCGQLVKEEALENIKIKLASLVEKMIALANEIKIKESDKVPVEQTILNMKNEIKSIEETINESVIDFQKNLDLIGQLQNDKLEVDKRNDLQTKHDQIPLKIENTKLKIKDLENVLKEYQRQTQKILENEKINDHVKTINNRLNDLKVEKENIQRTINSENTKIMFFKSNIENREKLVARFKEQERKERVNQIYQKCVHRDGIPTQILTTILLPKINEKLNQLLSNVDFSVWIDLNDLKLKMSYADFPTAVIDCISSSGKERTFSSICLKVALNEINAKSKPTIFMLDEVTGRLDTEESFDEFVDLLKVIKNLSKKLVIIEHNRDLAPDYLIHVKQVNNVSTMSIE